MSTATVARWIKSVLAAAGIDTSVFKPHSVKVPPLAINMSKVFQSSTFFVWPTGRMSTRFVNSILEISMLLSNSNIFLDQSS